MDHMRAEVSEQHTGLQQVRAELAGKANVEHVKEALKYKAAASDVEELRATKVGWWGCVAMQFSRVL